MEIIYNGYDLSEDFIALCDSRDLPEFEVPTTKIPGVDGVVLGDLSMGTRRVTVTLIAKRKNSRRVQYAARDLMAALAVDSPRKLYFGDERDPGGNRLHRWAVPVGVVTNEEFIRADRWKVEFLQADPHLYGKRRSVVVRKGLSVAFWTGGNCPTWWRAVATPASGSEYTLTLKDADGGNHHVTYRSTFDGEHQITVDARRNAAWTSPADGTSLGIAPGSRFERISGAVTISASHKTTLSWTEAWL